MFDKWKISLDTKNMKAYQNSEENIKIKEKLESVPLDDKILKELKAFIIIEKTNVLDCKSPASARSNRSSKRSAHSGSGHSANSGRSGGRTCSFDSFDDCKNSIPQQVQSSFSSALGQIKLANLGGGDREIEKEESKTVFSLHMTPAFVTLKRKLAKDRLRRTLVTKPKNISQFSLGISIDESPEISGGSSVSADSGADDKIILSHLK